jgi:hypothetical protein
MNQEKEAYPTLPGVSIKGEICRSIGAVRLQGTALEQDRRSPSRRPRQLRPGTPTSRPLTSTGGLCLRPCKENRTRREAACHPAAAQSTSSRSPAGLLVRYVARLQPHGCRNGPHKQSLSAESALNVHVPLVFCCSCSVRRGKGLKVASILRSGRLPREASGMRLARPARLFS